MTRVKALPQLWRLRLVAALVSGLSGPDLSRVATPLRRSHLAHTPTLASLTLGVASLPWALNSVLRVQGKCVDGTQPTWGVAVESAVQIH